MGILKRLTVMIVPALAVGAFVSTITPALTYVAGKQSAEEWTRDGVAAVQRDVTSNWDYSCPADAQCLLAWKTLPQVIVDLRFDQTKAAQAYAAIKQWSEFQPDYLTNKQKDYQKIVWSDEIFKKYYLPPHSQAGAAKPQWQAIYASLNPIVREAYTTEVNGALEALLADNLTYSLTYDDSLKNGLDFGLNSKLDWSALLQASLSRQSVLQKAGLKDSLLGNLFAGLGMPDLQNQLSVSINTGLDEIQSAAKTLYDSYDGYVRAVLEANEVARQTLSAPARRTALDTELVALLTADEARLRSLPEATVDLLKRFLAGKWNAQQIYAALADTNLRNSYNAIVFPEQKWEDVALIAQRMGEFMGAAAKLDAVSKAALDVPADAQALKEISRYGPAAASLIFNAISQATNFADSTSALNPSLSQFFEQERLLRSSALFKDRDLDDYGVVALNLLWSGQSVAGAFTDLLDKTADPRLWSERLNSLVSGLKTEKLSAALVKTALAELDLILHPPVEPSRAAFGALLGLGAISGLVAVGASYPLIRGFAVKRKYGLSFWQYARSRITLGAVFASSAIIAAVLIVLAVSGVV